MSGSTLRAPFVGRERELADLTAGLDAACRSEGAVRLLSGEPGIGKSRLAEELTARAGARGVRTLWGRCYEGEGAPAFWPWAQILRAALRDPEIAALHATLGPAAADIAQLLPEIQPEPLDPTPASLDPAQARFRLFEGVTSFLTQAAARRPLLLALDDLHWADAPSLLLLRFLARAARDAPLLILGTYRDSEVDRHHPLAEALAGLAREPHSGRLLLEGLSEAEAQRFIGLTADLSLPEAITAAIARETEGNPFFLSEVVRLLVASPSSLLGTRNWELGTVIPQSVRDVIGRRLDRLSPACSRTLTIAAVIGRDFSLSALERVGELSGDPLLEVLEEAEAARLIGAVPDGAHRFRFMHALIRETLYDELPATRRVRLHRQVGTALETLYARDPGPHLAELAHHFVQAAAAGEAERAVVYSRRAGDHALAVFAYEEAEAHYERALRALDARAAADDLDRCTLLLALGDAQQRAGEVTAARETFERAASEARRLGASDLLAQAALGYGGAGVQLGLVDERLIEMLEEALTALGDDRGTGAEPRAEGIGEGEPTASGSRRWGGAGPHGFPNSQRVRLLARLAMELYWTDARERRIAISGEAVELGRQAGDASALAFALSARHLAFWEPENVEERLAIGAEHLRVVASTGDRHLMLQGYARRIPDLLQVGNIIAAEQAIESHARLADELRQPLYRWEALRFRALTAYLHGRFDEMERLARDALVLAERAQIGGADVIFVSHLQFLRREQGRYAETEAPMKEIMARYPLLRDGWRNTLANLYAQTGRTVEAQREIDALATDGFDAVGRSLPALGIMALLTEAIAALGDARAAAVLYTRLEPYAARYIVNAAAPNFYGAAAHYLGMLAATMSRWDDAIAHFESALAMNTRTGVPSHIVYTQAEYAKALLNAERASRDADTRKAHELLDAALASARELGMGRTCDQIEQLQQKGRPTRHDVPVALNAGFSVGLTPREAEVLGLLASGMSNQQIAEALVVTVNTVERHLVSIYGKLGVKSRAAATAYAHRHGLT